MSLKETNKQRNTMSDKPFQSDTVITWVIFIGIALIMLALNHQH